MPKFDLSKTQEVQDLFAVQRDQRDESWIEQFYAAIVDASMATLPNQVIQGPDGFRYFVLNLPPAGQPFETFCLSHILDVCLENGFGVAIQPDANPPQWVFRYGDLWSFKEFGKFVVKSSDGEKNAATTRTNDSPGGVGVGEYKVFVGQPSASFFPPYARRAIQRFLTDRAGNSNPNVLLLHDPQKNPQQSLVFSLFMEDFASQGDFDNIMHRLAWYLPRHYGLLALPKDSELAGFFAPL